MDRPENDTRKPAESMGKPVYGMARALEEAGKYFMGRADVQKAARRFAARLDELGIDYAIAGALAVVAHGHVRMTTDVDVLLTPDGLRAFKAASLGKGWVERFAGSKGMWDTVHDVRIDVLLTGQLPGDGSPSDLAFPDPAAVGVVEGGVRVLSLPSLVELKIASGLRAPDRPRDFDDVIQLVRVNALGADFGAQLHPSVRAKFAELWQLAQRPTGEY